MTAVVDAPVTLWRVGRLRDPLVEAHGWPVGDPYVERFWLPVLGPSSTLALRALAGALDRSDAGVALLVAEMLAWQLGIGARGGLYRLGQTMRRLADYRMVVQGATTDVWFVRTHVGAVPPGKVARWPESVRAAHAGVLARRSTGGTPT